MFSFTKNENRLKTLRKGISSGDLNGRRVLLRLDLNLPMGKDKIIGSNEEWRMIAALPTIKYLIEQNAKVIIMTHLGRPGGKVVEDLRLGPIQDKLSELLDVSVSRTPDCIGKEVEKAISEMEDGEVLMLENLRFHAGEEKNDKEFAVRLAALGDIYINDAFSDSHRAHASIVGIVNILPSYAGFLMEKEYEAMEYASNPARPAVAIIGGAKLETKLPAVAALSDIYDYILVGGMIANEIINTSLSRTIGCNVILPINDGLVKQKYFDIGLNSVREFSKFIREAKSIVWNGPMGKFEEEEFSDGTRGVIDAIKIAYKNGARIIIGGGETIAAVQRFAPEFFEVKDESVQPVGTGRAKPAKGSIYISTGGGAMLDFLAGKKMPGVDVLKTETI